MTDDERAAVAQARKGRLASSDEAAEFWKSRGIT
jgi:hypothetical protein